MSNSGLVADTNILIYLLDGDNRLIDLLEDTSLYISFVSEIELQCSKILKEKENRTIDKLLSQSYIIEMNPAIKNETIYLRREYSLKLADAIIAATANVFQLPLITSDKDFNKLTDLNIIYYEK